MLTGARESKEMGKSTESLEPDYVRSAPSSAPDCLCVIHIQ